MLVVVVVAVGLGVEATRRRWAYFRGRAYHYAIAEEFSRREQQRMLKSIEFQLEGIKREGGEPNWNVGSLPIFRGLAAKHASEADQHARMKHYYETQW